MLRADITVVEPARFLHRQFKHLLRAGRERDVLARNRGGACLHLHLLFNFIRQRFVVNAEIAERARGDAFRLAAQSQEDMLGAHIFAAQAGRFLARRAHHVLCAFCKPFPHLFVTFLRARSALRGGASCARKCAAEQVRPFHAQGQCIPVVAARQFQVRALRGEQEFIQCQDADIPYDAHVAAEADAA